MHTTDWKSPQANEHRQRALPSRRKTVDQALREAYRRHGRDSFSRTAVRQALGT